MVEELPQRLIIGGVLTARSIKESIVYINRTSLFLDLFRDVLIKGHGKHGGHHGVKNRRLMIDPFSLRLRRAIKVIVRMKLLLRKGRSVNKVLDRMRSHWINRTILLDKRRLIRNGGSGHHGKENLPFLGQLVIIFTAGGINLQLIQS